MKTFMFVVMAALLVLGANVAMAQLQQDLHVYEANVAGTALELAVGTTTYDALAGGTCYTAPADPTGLGVLIDPFTGSEAVSQDPSVITGDPFADVQVSIVMPTILTDGAYLATMSYDGTSGAWTNDGGAIFTFFNPQGTTNVMNLAAGEVNIFLGGNICVPANVGSTTLAGQAIITCQYQ